MLMRHLHAVISEPQFFANLNARYEEMLGGEWMPCHMRSHCVFFVHTALRD